MPLESIDFYKTSLLIAGITLAALFVYGLYKALKPTTIYKRPIKIAVDAKLAAPKLVVTSSDISAIAGDDVMSTQLDLARAYIETGRHLLAKKILDHVREHGNLMQQDEAHELLKSI